MWILYRKHYANFWHSLPWCLHLSVKVQCWCSLILNCLAFPWLRNIHPLVCWSLSSFTLEEAVVTNQHGLLLTPSKSGGNRGGRRIPFIHSQNTLPFCLQPLQTIITCFLVSRYSFHISSKIGASIAIYLNVPVVTLSLKQHETCNSLTNQL